jgi:cell division protein FtsL
VTIPAQTGTTVAILIMNGVIAFLAFRLYDTRDQVRVLRRQIAALAKERK